MISDRELDEIVARKIFGCNVDFDCGFCVDGVEHGTHGDMRPWCHCETEKHYTNSDGLDTQFYSTEIAAAFSVGDEMKKRGLFKQYGTALIQEIIAPKFTYEESGSFDLGCCGAVHLAQASPRERCLAALKAVGVDVTEKP